MEFYYSKWEAIHVLVHGGRVFFPIKQESPFHKPGRLEMEPSTETLSKSIYRYMYFENTAGCVPALVSGHSAIITSRTYDGNCFSLKYFPPNFASAKVIHPKLPGSSCISPTPNKFGVT